MKNDNKEPITMKEQRIIFVGVHNKPGKMPLDSSTLSGRRVDKIIERIKNELQDYNIEFIKSNLFEVDYQPKGIEAKVCIVKWMAKYEPFDNPIVVLLGNQVQCSFPKLSDVKRKVRLAHPSLQYSKIKEPEYIANACNEIISMLSHLDPINH